VVERFRIVDGGKALEANVHVEDSGAFTMRWNAMQRYRRVEQGPMREAVCAENNAKFFNYEVEPIPQSDKPDFWRAFRPSRERRPGHALARHAVENSVPIEVLGL
jgi:hypothetical protein